MQSIISEKLSIQRDQDILKEMDQFVDWNMSAHPLSNLVNIARGGAFVARDHDTNIGMVYAFPYDHIGWIGFLIVNPAYRKRGIGTTLMTKAIDFLHQKGINSIGLYATEDGAPLYQKLGFTKVLTSWRYGINETTELENLKNSLKSYFNPSSFEVTEFSQIDHELFENIVNLDTKTFGANRRLIFENRLRMGSWQCTCILNGATLEAFGMWRLIDNHFGFIGPIVGLKLPVFQVLLPKIILQSLSAKVKDEKDQP
ncbi:MAG: GNAT family N-acetyltransferase [Candidatus Hodarchaeota archaeon]